MKIVWRNEDHFLHLSGIVFNSDGFLLSLNFSVKLGVMVDDWICYLENGCTLGSVNMLAESMIMDSGETILKLCMFETKLILLSWVCTKKKLFILNRLKASNKCEGEAKGVPNSCKDGG